MVNLGDNSINGNVQKGLFRMLDGEASYTLLT